MKTYIKVNKTILEKLPKEFIFDGRFEPDLVKKMLIEYSKQNAIVFDPFMGFGTSIITAEKMGMTAYGVEIDKERFLYAKSKIKNKNNIFNKDIVEIDVNEIPPVDICITSPTYAWRNNGSNPFNLNSKNGYYEEYLNMVKSYFEKIEKFIKDEGILIIDSSNIYFQDLNTTLAWDIKNKISEIESYKFIREHVICWPNNENSFLGGNFGFGYDHSYCLVFKKIKYNK